MQASIRDRAAVAVRKLQARALAATGTTARRLGARRGSAAILMYHRILEDDEDASAIEPGMYVRASTFERHLGWILDRFSVRTVEALLAAPPSPADPPVVALTFDDGWRDNATVAWPILKRSGLTATVFLVRDWCAAGTNGAGEFLRPEEIAALASEGLEFGAHTVTHPRLDRLDDARAEAEMLQSKEAVEAWSGRSCTLFAYPYGGHHEATAALARRHFRGSVIVGGGWWSRNCDPARIPRIGIHEDMSSTRALFEARLAMAADGR